MSGLIPDAEYSLSAGSPDWLAIGPEGAWVTSKPTDEVLRMDPESNKIVASIPVKKPCAGFAFGAGTLWSPSCEDKNISRIDLITNKVVSKVPVNPANTEGGIAFGSGSAWMPTAPGDVVSRIDPATNMVSAAIKVAPGSYTAVYGYGRVWVSSTDKSVVSVISPASNKVIAEIPVDAQPRFMAAGEGYVWSLNQGKGTVSKIDPNTMKVVATIEVGVPGGGGDISAGEGAVWVSARSIPVSRIDPATGKVTAQLAGPGGDALRVGLGYVWLSNGRQKTVWRFLPQKVVAAGPHSWKDDARNVDLDGDGKTDLLVEELPIFLPGEPARFHVKTLSPQLSGDLVLKTTLNGKTAQSSFERSGEDWVASLRQTEPRWIHYSVCIAHSSVCGPEMVVASPTTSGERAKGEVRFVADSFMVPAPPDGKYTWHILDPEILRADYAALESAGLDKTIAENEDLGELKRHRWEFQHQTAFAWGLLTADGSAEVACVYVTPSKEEGYDAAVHFLMTKRGKAENLQPQLDSEVREWMHAKWPFAKVAFPQKENSGAEN
jgi:YVTN family beta-propeller protein